MIIGISGKIGSGKDTVGTIIQCLTDGYDVVETSVAIKEKDIITTSDWEVKKFAGKLKDIVCLLIGCTREQLEDQDFKNSELGEEWTRYSYATGHTIDNEGNKSMLSTPCSKEKYEEEKRINWQTAYTAVLTPRLLLQLLGTEAGRDIIHTNIWVNSLFADYKSMGTRRMDIIDLKEGTHHKGKEFEVEDELFGSYPKWLITDMRFPNELKAVKSREGITIRVERGEGDGSTHESETALDNAEFDYTINNIGDIDTLVIMVRDILSIEKLIDNKVDY